MTRATYLTGILTDAALTLGELGQLRVHVGGHAAPNAELVAAIASLPGAEVEETVFVHSEGREPYVIRQARAQVGRVLIEAQCSRPATATEVESASRWTEHVSDFRSGSLPRTP